MSVIDKRGVKAIFLTDNQFKLLQEWLSLNLSCTPCNFRSQQMGWTEKDLELVETILREKFKL